jgi:hypothetical protein
MMFCVDDYLLFKRVVFMKFRLLITTLLATFIFCGSAVAQEVGKVVRASGDASAISASNQTRKLAKDDAVSVGDTLVCGDDCQIMVRMKDNSTTLVRAKSKVKISEFKFDNQPGDASKTTLLAGTMRAVSGQIGKGQPGNVKYEAGTATIGIRGTDIEVAIIPDGQKDRAGIYNYVYDGETLMALNTGESSPVEKELTGFAPAVLLPGEKRLQILRDRPAFLQSGGFDALMNQLTAPRIPVMR